MPAPPILLATASMMAELDSIPVLTASAPMSDMTAFIWDSTRDTGSSSTSVTPTVFWAVIAVRTEVP